VITWVFHVRVLSKKYDVFNPAVQYLSGFSVFHYLFIMLLNRF
jgi:hypothetical protein